MSDPTEPPDDSDRGNNSEPMTIHDFLGVVGLANMAIELRGTIVSTMTAHIKHEWQIDVTTGHDPIDEIQVERLAIDIASNVVQSISEWQLPGAGLAPESKRALEIDLPNKLAAVCRVIRGETMENILRLFAAAQILTEPRVPHPLENVGAAIDASVKSENPPRGLASGVVLGTDGKPYQFEIEGPGVSALRDLIHGINPDDIDADPTAYDVAAIVRAAQIVVGKQPEPTPLVPGTFDPERQPDAVDPVEE